jgi:hypothetical protein
MSWNVCSEPDAVSDLKGEYADGENDNTDYSLIEKFIESLGERFNIREIAFDRWSDCLNHGT